MPFLKNHLRTGMMWRTTHAVNCKSKYNPIVEVCNFDAISLWQPPARRSLQLRLSVAMDVPCIGDKMNNMHKSHTTEKVEWLL